MALEDKIHSLIKHYYASPPFVRKLAGKIYKYIPLSMRYGKKYNYYKKLLKQSQYWDDDQKNKYILENLQDTLINAYSNTFYYKNLFDSINFNPNQLKDGIDWLSDQVKKDNSTNIKARIKILDFDAKVIAKKYIDLYKSVLNRQS